MLKEYQKICIKIVVFSAIFFFLIQKIGYFLRTSGWEKRHNWEAFYKFPKNSLDAVFIGTSQVYTHVIPAVLWKEYGIKSYNLAIGGSPISSGYYDFVEGCKYQKNAIFVIDVIQIVRIENLKNSKNHHVTYNHNHHGEMNFSVNKIKAARNFNTPLGFKTKYLDILPVLFPLIQFHKEWKNVDKIIKEHENKYDPKVNNYFFRGYVPGSNQKSADRYGKTEAREPLPPTTTKYLYKIINFAKKTQCKVFFVKVASNEVSVRAGVNTIKDIVKQNNLPFFDFNDIIDTASHPLYSKGKRNNEIMGKYMVEHFDELKDKQYDPNDKEWADSIEALEWMDKTFGNQTEEKVYGVN
ncbi:MAG: hypothetical protein Ta2D_11320 [Rickettsiales bacterium]|nr:MAG: hypothetical protein Ta2D_11320 [Rickettsiales bacterium]